MSARRREVPRPNLRLRLMTPGAVPDGAGGRVRSWTELGVVWGELRARRGSARVQGGTGGAVAARLPVTVVLRAAPVGDAARPVPGQRFEQRLPGGMRAFRVVSVTEAAAPIVPGWLTCICEEEVAT
ncbi:MAG: head-tail adaptor protein [Celeribacter sp.]|jgi:head-tail adaptor